MFDGKLRLEFRGAKITSDAALLPLCQLDEAVRLTEPGGAILEWPRYCRAMDQGRQVRRPVDAKGLSCAEAGGDRRSGGGKGEIGTMERSDGQESHQDGLFRLEIEYVVRIGALVKV